VRFGPGWFTAVLVDKCRSEADSHRFSTTTPLPERSLLSA
jgi:hypothetical protein